MQSKKRAQHESPGTRASADRTEAPPRGERGHSYRQTRGRKLIADLLQGSDGCLTADDIHARVRALDRRIGLTSVYRTVKLLEKTGAIVRVDVGDGCARYETAERTPEEHHHHLVCVRCHRVVKYSAFSAQELALMAETERDLQRRFGYQITGHRVYFEGVCPGCQGKE